MLSKDRALVAVWSFYCRRGLSLHFHHEARKLIAFTCQQCGKEVEVPYPCHAKKRKYCSTTCFGLARRGAGNPSWKGGPVTRACDNCGKKYTSKRSANSKFCSQKCTAAVNLTTPEKHPRWRGGGVERVCQSCGKGFKVPRCLVEKGGGLYCSKDCSQEGQRTSSSRGV